MKIMPPVLFKLVHWKSNITDAEKQAILDWVAIERRKLNANSGIAEKFANEPVWPIPQKIDVDLKKAHLGSILYHHKALSGDGSISCATCHPLDKAGADALQTSTGIRKQKGDINAPTVFNAVFNARQFWDGRAKNLEEQAISLIGKDLYEAFIKGYTKKQWQRDPKELPSYIIKRLPFRTSYCFDYFNDTYQGIPIGGYTPFFKKLLSNNLIELKLNTDFLRIKKIIKPNDFVIYTGPVDEFFDFSLGKLEWRTLDFKWKTLNVEDYQGCAVLNEANANIPYTRTHEFKHYHPEILDIVSKNKTVICEEYSREYQDGDIQYYPIDTQKNRMLYEKYKQLALEYPNLILGGRLGMYKYFDMDKAILAALDTFNLIKPKLQNL